MRWLGEVLLMGYVTSTTPVVAAQYWVNNVTFRAEGAAVSITADTGTTPDGTSVENCR